jgi:hypothetical protein
MTHVALVRDLNPLVSTYVYANYTMTGGVSYTPTVFADGGYDVVLGGAEYDPDVDPLIPYYRTIIESSGGHPIPSGLDLVTAIEWTGDYDAQIFTVSLHAAVSNGVAPNSAPAVPSTPTGPDRFRAETSVQFETVATDPEGNLLRYQWDWGDGEVSDWEGAFISGDPATASHTYAATGDYEIRVKVRDPFGEETTWSPAYAVTVSCCEGRVGDANGSMADEPTIGDVSVITDALFIGGDWTVIPCLLEADINGSGGSEPQQSDITIGDVSYLIDYLFITGASVGLPDCP